MARSTAERAANFGCRRAEPSADRDDGGSLADGPALGAHAIRAAHNGRAVELAGCAAAIAACADGSAVDTVADRAPDPRDRLPDVGADARADLHAERVDVGAHERADAGTVGRERRQCGGGDAHADPRYDAVPEQ